MLFSLLFASVFAQPIRTPTFPDGFYEINLGPGRCVGSENCLNLGNDSSGLMVYWFPGQGVPDALHTVNRDMTDLPVVVYIGDHAVIDIDPRTGLEIVDGLMMSALAPGERGRVNTMSGTVTVRAQRVNGPYMDVKEVIDYRTGLIVRAYMGYHTREQTCIQASRVLNQQNRMTYTDHDCQAKR